MTVVRERVATERLTTLSQQAVLALGVCESSGSRVRWRITRRSIKEAITIVRIPDVHTRDR